MRKTKRIIGLVLAGAAVLSLASCGGNNDDLKKSINELSQKIEQLESKKQDYSPITDAINGVGNKVDGVSNKVDGVGSKVDGVDGKVDTVGNKVDNVDGKVDGVSDKVDDIDGTVNPVRSLWGTHDPETLINDQGVLRPHNYDEDGHCRMCDETTIFSQKCIALEYASKVIAAENKGTVAKVEYQGVGANGARDGIAWVYTPAGYDATDTNTKYDVLYMLHGMGLNEGFWFARGKYNPNKTNYNGYYCTENILDDLMATGEAKKAICVAFSFTGGDGAGEMTEPTSDEKKELTECLMPYIARNYNTYAKVNADSTDAQVDEALIANRDHQAFVGLSLGSAYSYNLILAKCLDYFAYVGSYSGADFNGPQAAIDGIKAAQAAGRPLRYWYNGLGTLEKGADSPWNGEGGDFPGNPISEYIAVVEACGLQQGCDITNGDNADFVWCDFNGHSYLTWATCLYNSLKVFFKAPIVEVVNTYTSSSVTPANGGVSNSENYELTLFADGTYKMELEAKYFVTAMPSRLFWSRTITSWGTYTADGNNYTLTMPTRIHMLSNDRGNAFYTIDTAERYSETSWLTPSEFNPNGYHIYQASPRSVPETWKTPEEFIAAYGREYSIAGKQDGTMDVTITSHNGTQIDGYYTVKPDGTLLILE